ncbi:unnamed protein product [Orchesella dallaii]|uniref:Uncharacterized protein n=1 Tax=Orchesella dallaii TaxID=48710 RepID=A0ABP1QXM3_9HEXA
MQGVYSVTKYDEVQARTYAKDLGWNPEQEETFIKMFGKHCGVRFETKDGKYYNITIFSDDRVAPMEIEDGKEVSDLNVVGIPVKNKLVKEPKALNVRQTMENGKYTDISWTFKPDQMIITMISYNHQAEYVLKKVG